MPEDLKDYVSKCTLVALLEVKVKMFGGRSTYPCFNKSSEEFLNTWKHPSDYSMSGNDTDGNFSEEVSTRKHMTVERRKGKRHFESLDLQNPFQYLLDASALADPPHGHHQLAEPESVGES